MSSTCFEHPRVHPQEDLHMQFYVIYFMLPYKQSAYMEARKKYNKTACASLPEDEHVDVRNMSRHYN